MSGNLQSPSDIDPEKTWSLYFHVPFCSEKCPYCHFYVIKDSHDLKGEELKDRLTSAFIQEISLMKSRFPKDKKLVSIYWGGGTPSLLGPKRVDLVHKALQDLLPFIQLDTLENTLEINPESITFELLSAYKESGINRISIGAQSFQEEELHFLGRAHSATKTIQTIDAARKAGIENISIDLMYDVPYQSYNTWKKSVGTAFLLPITHLSLYNLTIEPRTAFYAKKKLLDTHRPSEEIALQMYYYMKEEAEKAGFEQYEISAFSKKSYFSKHNSGYWNGRDFYGIGPSAYSFLDNRRFSHVPNIMRYIKSIESSVLEYENIDTCSPEERVKELFCVGIRLFSGVSLKNLQRRYNVTDTMDDLMSSIAKMTYAECLTTSSDDPSLYKLTDKGRILYDSIAAELI